MSDKITCCIACGWGNGSTPTEEIQEQKAKYGDYICKKCEAKFVAMTETKGTITVECIDGTSRALITETGIYYFQPRQKTVENPNHAFLGFGGSWHLVVDYEKNDVIVTNNLWHFCSIPLCMRDRMKNKVNCHIVGVSLKQLTKLKDRLNIIPYLKTEG